MNRRQMLAGTAALPAAALPIPALATHANGTDAAWHALVAGDADHGAAYLALDDAQQAIWTEPPPPPTVALPRLTGGEPSPALDGGASQNELASNQPQRSLRLSTSYPFFS